MKFLCIPCDTPMRLQTVAPPDRGSLSVVYSCPECGYEIAMLTNAYETQVVQSLGVRIGPESNAGAPSTSTTTAPERGPTSGGSCPFAAMIPAQDGVPDGAGHGASAAAQAAEPVRWTPAAEARLANVPAFVRPMAKAGIERFARENGSLEVNEKILDAAREFFGM
jgi:hypothetical protein